MAFIRVKRRRDSEGKQVHYAYLVENRWSKRSKQPKQRVKSYLGRVYRPDKNPIGFFDYYSIEEMHEYLNNPFRSIIKDLALWELHQHDVKKVEVDVDNADVRRDTKQVVLAMNQGFLCNHTLKQLVSVKNKEEDTPGYNLAKALVDAGIEIPKELFVGLYEKINSH